MKLSDLETKVATLEAENARLKEAIDAVISAVVVGARDYSVDEWDQYIDFLHGEVAAILGTDA